MTETNSLYTTTVPSDAPASSASVEAQSATAESSAVVSSAVDQSVASSAESAAVQLADKPLEERTTIRKIDAKHEDIIVIDKDGTKVSVQVQAPSYKKGLEIDALRSLVINNDGQSGMRVTPVAFQEGLFKLFNNFEINDKPEGRVNFDLADSHIDAYRVFIREATSFLDAVVNPV